MKQALLEQTIQRAAAARDGGDRKEAARLFRQVLSSFPNATTVRCELGNVLLDFGEIDSAIAEFRRALRSTPEMAEGWIYLGHALQAKHELRAAEEAFQKALEISVRPAEALAGLGEIESRRGRPDAALSYFKRALASDPQFVPAYNAAGNILGIMGRPAEGVGYFQRALSLSPGTAAIHYNLANALRDTKRLEEAVKHYQSAIKAQPGVFEFHNNLGNVLLLMGRPGEALACHQECLAMRPAFAESLTNMGNCHVELREFDKAIEYFRRAIKVEPDSAGAHNNLGLALLTAERYDEGFPEFEWRWRQATFTSPQRNFTAPQWDGRRLAGETILLHAEQGYGDTIQYARYIPMVVERGGRVVVECQRPLRRLLERIEGVSGWTNTGDAVPSFDFHCPFASLPLAFRTTVETIPEVPATMSPPADAVARWRERLSEFAPGLRVGIAWFGNPNQRENALRSIPVAELTPLADVEGVRFFSLQKENPGVPLDPRMNALDFTAELPDFAETAALMANLDLIITVCSAVAHLSGCVPCPTWTLLRYGADWRWHETREDSPWYPRMRLFRQTSPGDWKGVIERVAGKLAERVARGN